MTTDSSTPKTAAPATEAALQLAVAAHQAGKLQSAAELYLGILETAPDHAEANHNMGLLMVQTQRPADSLPYFMAALDADPGHGPTWLNYIDALFLSGQPNDARQILTLAKQQGLEGPAVDILDARLNNADQRQALPGTQGTPSANKPPKIEQSRKKPLKNKVPPEQETSRLLALFNQQHYAEAATVAHAMTTRYPSYSFGWKTLGVALKLTGELEKALIPMKKAVALLPGDSEALNNLGITYQELGMIKDAEASYRKALRINPDHAQTNSNLGSILQHLGQFKEAETLYRRALKTNPDYARAHNNLGALLRELHRDAEAEQCFRSALKIDPNYADAYCNLGLALLDIDQIAGAETSFLQSLSINPDNTEAHSALGITLYKLGRTTEAEVHCSHALRLKPRDAITCCTLGDLLQKLGNLKEAENCYRRSLTLQPTLITAHNQLGNLLQEQRRFNESVQILEEAIKLRPNDTLTLNNLGCALNKSGRQTEAEYCFRQTIALNPDCTEAYFNLGNTLLEANKPEEAEEKLRQAIQIDPDFSRAYTNLFFFLAQKNDLDEKALFEEHCRFGTRFEAPFINGYQRHENSRDPDRVLQIGFVSGDLRNHPIASFIEPILIHLSKYTGLTLHAYYNHPLEDNTSHRLKGYFSHWTPVAYMPDPVLADKIRADHIDILIDLSGHTALNRLPGFARKMAPIQATWMGYPGTTGLLAMDYYFSDRHFLPAGIFDSQFTEKIVRLPASAPFLPHLDAPPVNELPALKNGYITFGSFNRISKINRSVVALWAKLLRALPDSKMLLGGLPESGKHGSLVEWFADEGIHTDRLVLHARGSMDSYLKLHHQVDICLDTFPYNGGTTNLHALWMGVPTLTLTGKTTAGRTGVSVPSHVGLHQYIASDAEDFVSKGLSIAQDPNALARLRAALRTRFSKSAVGQPEVIAAGLEQSLRIMWQRWCAGLSPVSFEVLPQDGSETTAEAK